MNLKDYNNFARNVKEKLKKWGYRCEYDTSGPTITYIPTTAEERLAEIAIRQFKIDVQTDAYAFACFITALNDIDGFESMPWEQRSTVLEREYGVQITDRTLRSWCSKLISKNAVAKMRGSSYWKTELVNGIKVRSQVNREDANAYYARRTEILREEIGKNVLAGLDAAAARKEAWGNVYPALWAEFNCCYYCCKTFLLSAFADDALTYEIIELTREISGKEGNHG